MESDYIGGASHATGGAYSTPYGTGPHWQAGEENFGGPALVPSGVQPPLRKRLNLLAICENILLPTAIFIAVFGLMSFSVRYNHLRKCWFMLACGLAITFGFGFKGYASRKQAQAQGKDAANWYLFLFATCFLAWLLGLILGNINFSGNMERYYDYMALSVVRDIDPRNIPARQYMDVGSIYFLEDATVAEELSLGFKDDHVYCVAPIVLGNNSRPPASYDFWVVGVDCCMAMPPARFWCGNQIHMPDVHAGLRFLGDQSYFKLGIQQAVAEYHYAAHNPIFFTWTKDPVADVEAWRSQGQNFFIIGSIVYLIVQTFFVAVMASCYVKTGLARFVEMPGVFT